MKDILTNVLTTITCLLLASILVCGAKLFHEWCEKLKRKVKNDALKNLIEKVDYIVQLCVETTNQTFVHDKKQNGEFTEEDKTEAFNQTMNSITNLITDDDKAQIISEFGDLGTFLRNSVENYIKSSKDI